MKVVDVAAAAGVSPSTVSRVINGSPNISPATAELVRRVIKEMGCDLDQIRAGKAILGDQPGSAKIAVLTFGTLLPMDMVCLAACLQNLSQALGRQHIQMLYVHCPQVSPLPADMLRDVAGFILLQGSPPPEVLSQLQNKVVISLFCPQAVPGDRVLAGHYQIGQMAAQYFIEKKLQNLVFLAILTDTNPYFAEQWHGFKSYCRDAGIFDFCELVKQADKHIQLIRFSDIKTFLEPLVDQLLGLKSRPLGIFVPSCLMTAAVYRLLLKRNIIPDNDFKFICTGFEPLILAGLYPTPAAIDIGLEPMIEYAVNLLKLRLKIPGPHHPLQLAVRPTLIEPPAY